MKEVNEVIQKVSGTKKLSSNTIMINCLLNLIIKILAGILCVCVRAQELNSPFLCGMNMICQLMETNLRYCFIPST